MVDKLTIEEIDLLYNDLIITENESRLAGQLLETMRENERLRTGLQAVDGFCMWAYDLGDPKYYPDCRSDKSRAASYSWHLNHACYVALKALHPERADKGEFENLLELGDYGAE